MVCVGSASAGPAIQFEVRKLLANRCGATAAEYALILAVIGSVIAVAALTLGGAIGGAINKAATTIETCAGSC